MAVKVISDFSKYKGKISNSGHDERNRYSGGKAGDQTGNEWYVRNWYSRPWNVVIRFQDRKIANMLATLSIYAAQNKAIGYDQYQRTSYWTRLKEAGYDPRLITRSCEEDCSAGVLANTRAALELTGHHAWAIRININGFTGNMKSIIRGCGAGVKTFTDYSHTHSTKYLLPGDILLNTGAHTAVNLGIGLAMSQKDAVGSSTVSKTTGSKYTGELPKLSGKGYLVKGDKGSDVLRLQKFLKWYGTYSGSLDSSFGPVTDKAVREYQRREGLEVDGSFGPASLARAKEVRK